MNPHNMLEGYADQFKTPCIIVTCLDTPADNVIEWAQETGATYFDGEDNCLVVDIQVGARQAGPELYTESALRRTLRPKAPSPA